MPISMASRPGEWTLTEAARMLGEPQHRLIYLCEKGVVQPDLQDAEGRGSSRRFSARNLLEFAVALRLRDLEISVSLVGAVIHVLRAFERSVKRKISDFRLPESLREPGAPDLRVVIGEGARLYFTLALRGSAPKVYGGIDLREMVSSKKGARSLDRALARGKAAVSGGAVDGLGGPEGSRHARLEVSVTTIARDLRFEN
jgi:DNA-binding transcriptional MerR regulator